MVTAVAWHAGRTRETALCSEKHELSQAGLLLTAFPFVMSRLL